MDRLEQNKLSLPRPPHFTTFSGPMHGDVKGEISGLILINAECGKANPARIFSIATKLRLARNVACSLSRPKIHAVSH